MAYFSISIKQVDLYDGCLSKSKVRSIDGINKKAQTAIAYLIGQLGKNSVVNVPHICLQDILDEVFAVIHEAQKLVGGRMILLECENTKELVDLYLGHGFEVISMDMDKPDALVQMYMVVTGTGTG